MSYHPLLPSQLYFIIPVPDEQDLFIVQEVIGFTERADPITIDQDGVIYIRSDNEPGFCSPEPTRWAKLNGCLIESEVGD